MWGVVPQPLCQPAHPPRQKETSWIHCGCFSIPTTWAPVIAFTSIFLWTPCSACEINTTIAKASTHCCPSFSRHSVGVSLAHSVLMYCNSSVVYLHSYNPKYIYIYIKNKADMITAMYNSREQVRRVSWKQPTLPSLLPLKHSWMKIICKFLMQKPLFLNGHIYSLFTLSFQAFSKWTPQVLTVRRSSSRGKESAGPQLLSLLLWNPATSFPGTCPDSYRPLTTSL